MGRPRTLRPQLMRDSLGSMGMSKVAPQERTMTRPEVIENPVTGERAVFLQTAEHPTGELLRFDLFVRPGGFVPGGNDHIHPCQEESFLIRAGTARVRIAGEERLCGAGEEVTVPAGAPHAWWNAGDDALHAVVELKGPSATRFWAFATSFFALAQAGKTNQKGDPNLLRAAVILREYGDVLCAAPLFVQKVVVPPLALLGQMIGYRPDYPYPLSPPGTHVA